MKKIIFIFFLNPIIINATHLIKINSITQQKIIVLSADDFNKKNIFFQNNNQPNPLLKIFKKKHRLNKRVTAAILAFPFPFGIVGLHRIYLETEPHVPVVYIASLGGVFGILPLIDFIVITADKDFNQYKNNGKVLMWVRN